MLIADVNIRVAERPHRMLGLVLGRTNDNWCKLLKLLVPCSRLLRIRCWRYSRSCNVSHALLIKWRRAEPAVGHGLEGPHHQARVTTIEENLLPCDLPTYFVAFSRTFMLFAKILVDKVQWTSHHQTRAQRAIQLYWLGHF